MNQATIKKTACSTKTERSAKGCGPKAKAKKCAVPCCEIRVEECAEGCKIYCTSDDMDVCAMLQKMCDDRNFAACCMQVKRDGAMCCECCFDCCDCTREMCADGICVCCSANDASCLEMVQAMCRCLCCCLDCGCECTLCVEGDAVCCCGCC